MTDDFMGDGGDPAAKELKRTLIDIITWAERNTERTLQVELGPSDLGSECDRRIGYRLAGVAEVNVYGDPWVTFVGSAIHSRLQESIDKWERLNRGKPRFRTEMDAPLDEFIKAHPDLLDIEKKMVIDHKSTNTDFLKKIKTMDPHVAFPGYIIQVQLYGLAFEKLGYEIEKVALAFYPRSGWLKSMFTWVGDYDRDIALAAYQRPYDIAALLTDLDVLAVPSRWAQVPAVSSNACGYCPMYDPNHIGPADDTGCPGNGE